jgi:hypothetical protein
MQSKTKTTIAALTAAISITMATLNAQTTQVVPNSNGGYNIYDPNNGTTQVVPNGNGGYNVYDPNLGTSQVVPNNNGGYNIYGPVGGLIPRP